MKTLSKKQLAQKMGISRGTLQNYLNNRWYKFLMPLGYSKNQRIMSPKQIEFIIKQWGDIP